MIGERLSQAIVIVTPPSGMMVLSKPLETPMVTSTDSRDNTDDLHEQVNASDITDEFCAAMRLYCHKDRLHDTIRQSRRTRAAALFF
jgi:hypothetical protein